MFVLRFTLLLAIVAAFAPTVEAQLFRFRRPVQQPQQAPANYNAGAYRYTQVQAPVTNVPSPQCRQRVVYVPVQPQPARNYDYGVAQRQLRTSQQPQTTQQIVMLNVRDPYTGRTVQRPYLITRSTGNLQQPQAGQQQAAARSQSVLSDANPSGVVTPNLAASPSTKVATTSFNSPVDEGDTQKDFSILDSKVDSPTADPLPPLSLDSENPATSETEAPALQPAVLEPTPLLKPTPVPATTETAAPGTLKLDLPESDADSETPGGLELEANDSFDLDLPPLGSDGT